MVLPCHREIIKIHMNYNKLVKLFSAVLLAALCAGSVQAQTNLVHWSNTPGPGGTEGPGTGTGLDGAYATYQLTSFGHYIVTLSNLNTVVTSGYKLTDFVFDVYRRNPDSSNVERWFCERHRIRQRQHRNG